MCLSAALLTSLTSSSFFPTNQLSHVLIERVAVGGNNRGICGLPRCREIIVCGLVSVEGLRQVKVVGVVVAEVNWADGTKVVRANTKERV